VRFAVVLAQGTTGGRADVFTTASPVKLAVTGDDPPKGVITILLWEFDPPAQQGGLDVNEPTRRDLIVAIQGKVVPKGGAGSGYRFEPEPSHHWPNVAAGPRTFLLEIDGLPGTHRVAIPPDAGRDQGDLYSAAWKVMVRAVRGTPPTGPESPMIVDDRNDPDRLFDSRSWVLLRDFRNFRGDGRPVVAIIAVRPHADGTPDPYAVAAEDYWRTHADVIATERTLESILRLLRAEQKWGAGYVVREWALGPWGEVNIIAHGWLSAWNMAILDQSATEAFLQHRQDDWIDRFTLEATLRRYASRLRPPAATVLDERSAIVIRGCVLGRSAALAGIIHRIFGGRAPTYVGKLIGAYGTHPDLDRGPTESFAHECWVIVRPMGSTGPSDAQLIDFLIRKYDAQPTDARQPGFDRGAYDGLVGTWRRRLADHVVAARRLQGQLVAEGDRALFFEVDLRDHPGVTIRLANKDAPEREEAVRGAWSQMFEREKDSNRHEDLRETAFTDFTWAACWEIEEERKYVVIGNARVLLRYPYYRDFEQVRPPLLLADREDPKQYLRVT